MLSIGGEGAVAINSSASNCMETLERLQVSDGEDWNFYLPWHGAKCLHPREASHNNTVKQSVSQSVSFVQADTRTLNSIDI